MQTQTQLLLGDICSVVMSYMCYPPPELINTNYQVHHSYYKLTWFYLFISLCLIYFTLQVSTFSLHFSYSTWCSRQWNVLLTGCCCFFPANIVVKHIVLHILIITCKNVVTCVQYWISAHLFLHSIFTGLIWFKISNICMWAWNIA